MQLQEQITEDAFRHYVAPDIKQIQERFWAAEIIEQVSYPVADQAQLAKTEETSFWFRHRNEILAAVMDRFRPAGKR